MKPKYQTLKETLIEQIRTGAFAEEFPIPSEAELSAKYSVSRDTVRQAMKELENEGYLYRARGKGTFIRNISSLNSRKIALLIYDSRDLCHPETMKTVSALSETLEQKGFLLDILASHRTFQEENLAKLRTLPHSTTGSVQPRSKTALLSSANMFLRRKVMKEQKLKKPDSASRNWTPARTESSQLRTTRRRHCWMFSADAASRFPPTSC